MTVGAGMVSLAVVEESRAGAETGGGTTAAVFIRMREGATSCPAAVGAGGITLALIAGAERDWSRETRADAGAITLGFKDGVFKLRSEWRPGAGGTTAALRAADRDVLEETVGAGGTTALSPRALRS